MNKNEFKLLLEKVNNQVVWKSLLTSYQKINSADYKNILCSVSGGSDSDIVIDNLSKCDVDNKIDYVFLILIWNILQLKSILIIYKKNIK